MYFPTLIHFCQNVAGLLNLFCCNLRPPWLIYIFSVVITGLPDWFIWFSVVITSLPDYHSNLLNFLICILYLLASLHSHQNIWSPQTSCKSLKSINGNSTPVSSDRLHNSTLFKLHVLSSHISAFTVQEVWKVSDPLLWMVGDSNINLDIILQRH